MPDTPPPSIDDTDTPPATQAPRAPAARVPSGASAAAQTAPIADVPATLPADLPVLTEVVSLPAEPEPLVLLAEPVPVVAATDTEITADAESATNAEPAKPTLPELSPAECATRLAELFPALFATVPNTAPKPIKLRIQADIQARAPGLFSRKSLSPFLHRHTTSTAYLRALVGATHRYDLDGAPAGEVSDEHRQAAQLELDRRRAIVQARRAAERQAARGPASAAGEPAAMRAPQPRRDASGPQGPRGPRPPREHDAPNPSRPARPPKPPRGAPPAHARRDAAVPPTRHQRPDRAPRHASQMAPSMPSRPEPVQAAAALPDDPARRERALLLRAYEATTLSRANFCALKRIDPSALDALLEQARSETRPAASPKRPGR